jgi:hypothetical protein
VHERVEEPAPTHQLRLGVQNIRDAARVRDAVNELLIEAQQPHGKGGSAEIRKPEIGCDHGGDARRVGG